jgi:hypothetical protein
MRIVDSNKNPKLTEKNSGQFGIAQVRGQALIIGKHWRGHGLDCATTKVPLVPCFYACFDIDAFACHMSIDDLGSSPSWTRRRQP